MCIRDRWSTPTLRKRVNLPVGSGDSHPHPAEFSFLLAQITFCWQNPTGLLMSLEPNKYIPHQPSLTLVAHSFSPVLQPSNPHHLQGNLCFGSCITSSPFICTDLSLQGCFSYIFSLFSLVLTAVLLLGLSPLMLSQRFYFCCWWAHPWSVVDLSWASGTGSLKHGENFWQLLTEPPL